MRPLGIAAAQWRFYWRHGAVIMALALAAFEGLALSFLTPPWNARAAACAMLADAGVMGFFFLGALAILERQQGMAQALHVLPSGRRIVLGIRLAFFALMAFGLALGLGLLAGVGRAAPALAAATALSSLYFTLLGDTISQLAPSMNAYLLSGGIALVPGLAGLVPLLGFDSAWLGLSPSYAPARAMASILGQEGAAGQGLPAWALAPLFLLFLIVAAGLDALAASRARRMAA
jgi:fluoroquinolone transport system permease protein